MQVLYWTKTGSSFFSPVTALLGRLFASQHADYGREYPKIFREFLGRFKDKESKIRQQMISIGVVILQRKPHLAEAVISELKQRLHDLDAEVRGKIVKDFCEVAVQSISLVPEDAMRELGERWVSSPTSCVNFSELRLLSFHHSI